MCYFDNMNSDEVDLYKVLGISRTASMGEVRRRYQVLAKKYHPDHDGDDALMILINQAYKTLSNPQKRIEYNRSLNRNPIVSAPNPVPPASAPVVTHSRQEMKKPKIGRALVSLVVALVLAAFVSSHSSSSVQTAPPIQNPTATNTTPQSMPAPTASAVPQASEQAQSSTPDFSKPALGSSYAPIETPSYTPPIDTSTSCSSNSIGSYDYTNCYGGGGSTSCTSNTIGTTGFTNCYGSGGSMSCTSNSIGDYKYTNCY